MEELFNFGFRIADCGMQNAYQHTRQAVSPFRIPKSAIHIPQSFTPSHRSVNLSAGDNVFRARTSTTQMGAVPLLIRCETEPAGG
jgi:hypothetical protein